MKPTVSDTFAPTMNIADLWRSSESEAWERSLERYWQFVQPRNVELERALDALDVNRLCSLTPQGWYNFLHDEYFRWKYTAPNRYATTTIQLRKYLDGGEINELESLRQQLLSLDRNDIRRGITTAKKIRGLGTAGASGLLSLMYPEHFATVDQFVVKALRLVPGLPEAAVLARMNPENLSISDGVLLVGILTRKANENNQSFGTSAWTPRRIDMVLWTYGR
ncbi:hypothetical protein [Nitrosomonas sp. Nm132]|jgi:hypothetical protein|uniref:hypothetical protein n=1 Tax=Nitrosomonas sp. Nm132 TaxID=1881053 RepID=UPI00087F95A8|nr:hypothetical protein [Nitrosomonas sp. Nm132]SDH06424.1 hypothetical protein SAMN05428952_1004139 [Nitrosomonas sp. Nm132]